MSKSAIARLFTGGVVAIVLGLALALGSSALGLGAGAYVLDGADIVGLRVLPAGIAMSALAGLAATALVGGVLALVVAWAAALANALTAARHGWFAGMVALGVPTCGFAAVIAYLLGGPDRGTSPA